jgi:uncharacterized protein
VTAWVTLGGMWVGGGIADRLLDRPGKTAEQAPTSPVAAASSTAP